MQKFYEESVGALCHALVFVLPMKEEGCAIQSSSTFQRRQNRDRRDLTLCQSVRIVVFRWTKARNHPENEKTHPPIERAD